MRIQKIPSGFFLVINIIYIERIASLLGGGGGSVPEFLRKTIATFDFQVGWGSGPPVPLSGPALECIIAKISHSY